MQWRLLLMYAMIFVWYNNFKGSENLGKSIIRVHFINSDYNGSIGTTLLYCFYVLIGLSLHKSSCCYFSHKSNSLEDAEIAMLELYCERSQLKDGHTVLDVGCGWGSLSLYIAQKYSNCKITGICNSKTQKEHIDEQCR